MTRRLLALVAALALAIGTAGPATAHHPASDESRANWLLMYETPDFDIYSDHWFHGKWDAIGWPDMRTQTGHFYWTGPTSCQTPGVGHTWNNCVSSYYVKLAPGWCLRTYNGFSYQNRQRAFANATTSPRQWEVSLDGTPDDNNMSSFRFGPFDLDTGTCLLP